ncbi:MAG: aminotransferase class V-fold PLP-dependent enzyme [Myxococcota bacterium]
MKAAYRRISLAKSQDVEIILCQWTKGHTSPDHSHGWSSCKVLVQQGRFMNITAGPHGTERKIYEAGDSFSVPIGASHEVTCLSSEGVTIHLYSPPLGTATDRTSAPLDLAIGPEGLPWHAVEQLANQVELASVPTASPRFMNQLFSGVHQESLLADRVVAQTRTTLATRESSPVFSAVEDVVVDGLCAQFGWPSKDRGGIGVPGGSAANFMAIHVARHRRNPELKQKGLTSGPRFSVFVSEAAHYSFLKGAAALGLGTDALIRVATDEIGRMDVDALRMEIDQSRRRGQTPLLVVATAGTTVFGAFDPIDAMADIAQQEDLWLHVDGAWGGPAVFSERLKAQLNGIERADSVTFDAHKLLGATLTSSFFLTRHAAILLAANDSKAGGYIFHGAPDLGRMSWQCGRRADAFGLWMLWKSRGTQGFGQLVDHLLDVRDGVVAFIRDQPRLKLLADPSFLNVCVEVVPPDDAANVKDGDWSMIVREKLKGDKQAWVNYARDRQDRAFLRLIMVHPNLVVEDVVQMLEAALAVSEP